MKRIVILGAGESGIGSAILAQKQGFEVFVSDMGTIAANYVAELAGYKIAFEQGMHTEALILNADEVIKSPGIPDKAPIIKKLKEKGTSVVSEIEFAGRYTTAKMICITGSNGKTTTTLLTYHILKNAGLNVGLGGNIGKSFAKQVALEHYDYYVLELSSFQLDGMYNFKADIAILTNITPDHLDRYDYKLENYAAAKFRVIQNQTAADAFIYCTDDEETLKGIAGRNLPMQCYPISITNKVQKGAFVADNILNIHTNAHLYTMTITQLALQGKHNWYNSMAAGITAKLLDITDESMRSSLGSFKNADHRLEHVASVAGIEFINDSKATNVNSAWYALESMTAPTILILGGVDKGNDYSMLKNMVKEKVKAIICLGKDNKKIHDAFEGDVEIIVNSYSAADAVKMGYHMAQKGDVVLLSPACASFDLFKNYEDRGNQFKAAVREL